MLQFSHVGLRYSIGPEILSDINLDLEPGSFHFLNGPSGSGKTSLMRLMYLSHLPSRGVVKFLGQDTKLMTREQRTLSRQKVGVVFQDFRLMPTLNVFDNIALPLRIAGMNETHIRGAVEELMEWVGLSDYRRSLPPLLSGGQQQRVAIARAVIAKPRLLLADEPTGNLDDAIGYKILNLFEQLNRMGTTIIIATHNAGMIEKFNYPCMVLNQGRLHVQPAGVRPRMDTYVEAGGS